MKGSDVSGRKAPVVRWSLIVGTLFGGLLGAPTAGQSGLELRERLQCHLDSIVDHSAIPGMTLGVALPDGGSFGLAAGWADTLRGRRMGPGDKMLDGSVGKTFFGAVVLQLVSEGRLDLDANVRDYLGTEPWFTRIPNAGLITVRQLMNHTSGVVRYELNPNFLEDLSADPLKAWTPEERLSYLFDAEPPFAPGEGWDYSDTNYILVAMIIERVTGSTAYEEIQRRILDPFRLAETVPSDSRLIEGLIQGYAGSDNPFGGFEEMLQDGRMMINPQFEWGGGGFASTSEDLAVWATHIHEGRAFDASLLPEFRDGPSVPLGPKARYGLGVIMMELPVGTAWGHSGYMPGYRTEMYYFPRWGFALAIQINSSDDGVLPAHPLRLLNGFAEDVVDWLEG